MKVQERTDAIRLRRQGESIKAIARRLGVSVASVSTWVAGVELTTAQRARLSRNIGMHPSQRRARALRSDVFRVRRAAAQLDGRLYARAGDPLHVAGCMLYWAEGDKQRNQVRIANADPEVLRLFLRFIRAYFVVPEDRIRVTLYLYEDHRLRVRALENAWLEWLELTRRSLLPSRLNPYSRASKRKRTNVLPFGTCHICISRTEIAQHIFGAIQEYGGFERPEWLDRLSPPAPPARS
jgi:hypothetical protein